MVQILKIKERILTFISRHELYTFMAIRLCLALITFFVINGLAGVLESSVWPAVLIALAAACAFLPSGFMMFLSAALIVLHFWTLSHVLAIFTVCIFGIMFFMYFRFTSRKGYYTILTGLLSRIGIPFVMPVAVGLIDEPQHVISVLCGSITSFLIGTVQENAAMFTQTQDQDPFTVMTQIGTMFFSDRRMLFYQIGFVAAALAVYLVKRSAAAHSREIALVIGTVVMIVLIGGNELFLGNYARFFLVLAGCLISAVISWFVSVFALSLDYTSVESVQFEDDEYYYYVKAVPKTSVKVEDKQIETIAATDDAEFEMPEAPDFKEVPDRGKHETVIRQQTDRSLDETIYMPVGGESPNADPHASGQSQGIDEDTVDEFADLSNALEAALPPREELIEAIRESEEAGAEEFTPRLDAMEDDDFLPEEKPEKSITIIGQR